MDGAPSTSTIPDALLRDALEVAFIVAVAGARAKPPIPAPPALKPYLKLQRLPDRALSVVRKIVEGDEAFRELVRVAAVEELVGRAGFLWMHRPEGWADELEAIANEQTRAHESQVASREDRSARKRLDAAETAARRAVAELAVEQKAHEKSRIELQRERANRRDIDHQLERSTARGVQLDIELSAARRKLGDVEPKLARATEALATAEAALGKADATARLVEARLELARTDAAQPGNDARTAPLSVAPAFNRAAVVDAMAKAARAGREMAAAFEAIADVVGVDAIKLNGTDETAKTTPIGIRQRRRAMTPLPGGVGAGSREAAEHLMRVKGVELLIDGYNLAKRVWPDAILEEQRRLAIDLSDEVGARMRHTVIVVFDGAAVSSPASGRRWVSVRFSEAGMIADDLIVEIVASIPLHRPVVVVTDDAELRERTSALGASAIRLDSFLTAARRSLN